MPASELAPGGFAITAVGLLTAVGLTVESSCAALRAGVVRAREINECPLAEGFAVGHQIADLTEGFVHSGFWVRAGSLAVLDLMRNGVLPDATREEFWRRTAIVAVAPLIDADRFCDTLEPLPDALVECFMGPLVDLLGLPIPPVHLTGVASGHAGIAEAVHLAAAFIARGSVERAVVVGVESHLDPTSLQWLADRGRLKGPDRPAGVMPGEAAAAILLEAPDAAAARHAPYVATVSGAATVRDAAVEVGEKPEVAQVGRAMARAMREAFVSPPSGACHVIVDLNGEPWRAQAWGHAQVHLAPHDVQWQVTAPAESFGEIGAASGVAALCVGVQGFARGYITAEQALVSALSDSGLAGAVHLRRAGGSDRTGGAS
jgi:3-oxoacyl-[acyl-carrier-protein] synthase-1